MWDNYCQSMRKNWKHWFIFMSSVLMKEPEILELYNWCLNSSINTLTMLFKVKKTFIFFFFPLIKTIVLSVTCVELWLSFPTHGKRCSRLFLSLSLLAPALSARSQSRVRVINRRHITISRRLVWSTLHSNI